MNPHDPAVQDTLLKCLQSTAVCAKTMFPNRFRLPFSPKIHIPIFDFLDHNPAQFKVVAAPRGVGKTSIMALVKPAKEILFRRYRFIMLVSKSATNAVFQAENLKSELVGNHIIRSLFGPMETDDFSRNRWQTRSGTMVYPRGAGQQVRGALFKDYRPDLILVDDLEDDKLVANEEQRKKLEEWFFASLLNCIDRSSPNTEVIVMGTVLHEGALLTKLLTDPGCRREWAGLRLELCDDDYHSNWPEFMSDDKLASFVQGFRDRGQMSLFYREYRNLSVATEDNPFATTKFQYYNEAELLADKTRSLETVLIVDPARTLEAGSCKTAIIAVGIDLSTNAIYVRDVVNASLYPDQIYSTALQMARDLGARTIGIEETGLGEFVLQPFKNYLSASGSAIELIGLKARGKKEDRVAALAPYYRRGWIFHNPVCSNQLEEQLLSFPRSQYWDIIDALAYIVEMLELGNRYFFLRPQDETADHNLAELEYAELMAETRAEGPLANARFF